jgi:hypothetical protein
MGPIDTSFQFPRFPVGVVDWGPAAGEAQPIRELLENLRAVVTLHQPGTPKNFLRVLGQGEAAGSASVICAHDDANGFVFGPLQQLDLAVGLEGLVSKRSDRPKGGHRTG